MVGLNPLVYIIGTKITYPAIGMLLVIVGVGALLHDQFWAAAVIVAINLAWIACAFAFGIPVSPAIFASQLVKADALAIVLNVARHRTLQRMEQAREEVHRLATTDELTGVANQRGFLEVGRSLTEAPDEEDPDLAIVYVDVDGLKLVNDLHGHSAGDALIQSVAEVLKRTFRPEDTVARVGGDEFAVLVVGGTPVLARDLTSRVHERLKEVGISASIGVASSQAGARMDLGELLGRADAAMYGAKSARKNGGS
ncbi:MAG TPA: GGDEF domain-containing protein [Nakamurella sp.]|nr:GGDEF domain-containing protein [Nakamurella sp.]